MFSFEPMSPSSNGTIASVPREVVDSKSIGCMYNLSKKSMYF